MAYSLEGQNNKIYRKYSIYSIYIYIKNIYILFTLKCNNCPHKVTTDYYSKVFL